MTFGVFVSYRSGYRIQIETLQPDKDSLSQTVQGLDPLLDLKSRLNLIR